MSADREAAYAAAVASWVARLEPVLGDVAAARGLALAVVGLLVNVLAIAQASEAWTASCRDIARLLMRAKVAQKAGGRLPCAMPWCEVSARSCEAHATTHESLRREAWSLAGRLFSQGFFAGRGWGWEQRAPYEVAVALVRALEADDVLTRGTRGQQRCRRCNGRGAYYPDDLVVPRNRPFGAPHVHFPSTRPCDACRGTGWQPSPEPVAPPVLALLLHDAHGLLTDLRAGPEELAALVDKAVCDAGPVCRSCSETGAPPPSERPCSSADRG